MNVVGLVSCYKEGRLVSDAIASLQRVRLDELLVYEGPAGDPIDADVPESEFPDDLVVVRNAWKRDASKRDAMLKAVHKLHLDPPVWGVWLDGDEILGNGEYLRDILQALAWDDENSEDPWARWPLRLIESDGRMSLITGRVVRLDLIRSYDISTSVVTTVHGNREGWGNVPEDSRVWVEHFMGAIDKGMMTAWPPLPCEPYIFHRSHLRHPLRRKIRMHTQETAELAKVKEEKASTLVVTSTSRDGSREKMLAETMRRYRAECPWAVWRVAHKPNIGDGWTAALGDDWRDFAYIHLMADDAYMEPGFWQAAVSAQERGVIPGPRALHPDGRLQSCGYEWERELQAGDPVPNLLSAFLTPTQLEAVLPFPSLTLYIDFVITRRLLAAGYEIEHVPAFCYRHMGKVGGTHDAAKDEATYASLER